jgi:hypothetical protein
MTQIAIVLGGEKFQMRGIYKSIAIAVASLSLLGAPAQAAVDTTALNAAITANDTAGVQALINAASSPADLAVIANLLTTASGPGGTVNTALLVSIGASNGGNGPLLTALGTAMATNLTPSAVTGVLSLLLGVNPLAANTLGPVIFANGGTAMQLAVVASGATSGGGGGGPPGGGGGDGGRGGLSGGSQGSERSGQVNGSGG